MQCYVYRGTRKQGAYLYLKNEDNTDEVPQELLKSLGTLSLALSFELKEDRKLAQTRAETVIQALEKQGYYLQLPISAENLLRQLPNSKPPE